MSKVRSLWLVLFASLVFSSTNAFAGFGLNLGYNNLRGADIGLNLLFRGQRIGGEIGFGYVNGMLDGDQRVYTNGDFDIKFFISKGGKIEPYIQLGASYWFAVNNGVNFHFGDHWFAGLGLMFSSKGAGKGLMGFAAADYLFGTKNEFYFEVGLGYGF